MRMVRSIVVGCAVSVRLASSGLAQTGRRAFRVAGNGDAAVPGNQAAGAALRAMGSLLRLAVEQVEVDEQNRSVSSAAPRRIWR